MIMCDKVYNDYYLSNIVIIRYKWIDGSILFLSTNWKRKSHKVAHES